MTFSLDRASMTRATAERQRAGLSRGFGGPKHRAGERHTAGSGLTSRPDAGGAARWSRQARGVQGELESPPAVAQEGLGGPPQHGVAASSVRSARHPRRSEEEYTCAALLFRGRVPRAVKAFAAMEETRSSEYFPTLTSR